MRINTKHVFITGTDTGVGKSIFSAFLALYWHSQEKRVVISKPIQTGSEKDTDFLSVLTEKKIPIFNTYSFNLPAAPAIAAQYENKKIDKEKIIMDIKKLEQEFEYVIVEGIGGIAVPLSFLRKQGSSNLNKTSNMDSHFNGNDMYLVADLIKDLNYPAIIVARPSLGTINHTALTIDFAKQRKLNILGFVVSGYDENTNDPVIKTAPDVIQEITSVRCLTKLPLLKKVDSKSLEACLPWQITV